MNNQIARVRSSRIFRTSHFLNFLTESSHQEHATEDESDHWDSEENNGSLPNHFQRIQDSNRLTPHNWLHPLLSISALEGKMLI
ncbi:hypothetical protein PMAYCL1PPCAC_28898 [Pristionchus mayeri]|uniref:Uncharacterized protein n=1 Tax=Pristionchus mayeri TaxID=1317129 RepID=A0AAN5D8Y3_9BILA|nr:hypothetical protein PMAYCL1PPCAC_28898 [Pristionchus mayeri]